MEVGGIVEMGVMSETVMSMVFESAGPLEELVSVGFQHCSFCRTMVIM